MASLLPGPAMNGGVRVVQYASDGRGEPGPVGAEGRQALPPGLGNGVVAPGSLALVVPPFAGDQARVAQPVEQRVDRAIAGQQAAGGGEVADELQPESGPELEQREDAWPQHAPPQFGQATLSRHVAHDALSRKICKPGP